MNNNYNILPIAIRSYKLLSFRVEPCKWCWPDGIRERWSHNYMILPELKKLKREKEKNE